METFTPRALEDAARSFASSYPTGTLVAAFVAGSGITLSAPGWQNAAEVPYAEVFPFPVPELLGHTPTVTVWRKGEAGLLVFNGRFHLYQGFDAPKVAAIPRLAALLGAPVYVATNATGAIDRSVQPGSLVVISDHINVQGTSPLLGEWGRWRAPMFPDLTGAYDLRLRTVATRCAEAAGFPVREGVYVASVGPAYETPAEVEAYRRMGGTVVGMSTVQEVIAAHHLGMRVLVLSLVTNLAAGIAGRPLTHQEVIEAGRAAHDRLESLLQRLIAELAQERA
jgi:purine-nucleoside phosphorylase